MVKKLSLENVSKIFEENGCVLLSKEYINNSSYLDFKCVCGNDDKVTLAKFKEGRRCKECGIKKVKEKLSLSYDYVQNYFLEHGCILLSDRYENSNTDIWYLCACGKLSKTTFGNYKYHESKRCRKCSLKIVHSKNRRSLKEIQDYFAEFGCELITDNYINTKQTLKYVCRCGNKEATTNFESFSTGKKTCSNCMNVKYDFKYVKKYFEDSGCTLLSTSYKYMTDKLDYICKCNSKAETQFYRFLAGQRCMKCRDLKFNIGEKSLKWNGGITSISNYARGRLHDWIKDSKNKCDNKCIITGSSEYDVHHLYSFNKIFSEVASELQLEIRPNVSDYSSEELDTIAKKTIEVNNRYGLGVCIREDLHYDFHKEYKHNNTPNQFIAFVEERFPNKIMEVRNYIVQSIVCD